jgi:MFS family permease
VGSALPDASAVGDGEADGAGVAVAVGSVVGDAVATGVAGGVAAADEDGATEPDGWGDGDADGLNVQPGSAALAQPARVKMASRAARRNAPGSVRRLIAGGHPPRVQALTGSGRGSFTASHPDSHHTPPATGTGRPLRAAKSRRTRYLRPALTDVALLFTTRTLRLFSYGFLAVVLVLYLSALGLGGAEIGLLLALTLIGDAVISLWLTTHADRVGRRRVLVIGALLVVAAGLAFVATPAYAVLVVAATVGVISPTGNEVGPFLAVEQASLAQLVPSTRRTAIFARYQLVGALATAAGTLAGGWAAQLAINAGAQPVDAYRLVIVGYAVGGALLALLFLLLSPAVEVEPALALDQSIGRRLGLHRSQAVVLRLSALFALDAFAGGFVAQSFIAYWFSQRFGLDPGLLGALLAGANLLAGLSALAAAPLAARFGLVRTMVFSHLPSNVLLLLVPFMPSLGLAAGVLLARFAISQMDVPTRQSYTMAIVAPDERSAAAGVTGIARSVGVSASPLLAGPLYVSAALAWLPFVISGGLKIVYDVALYRSFVALRESD